MKQLLWLWILTIMSACGSPAPEAMVDKGWRQYKAAFVSPDGSVADTGNKGISHSEGQGYAMLLAEAYGDRSGFERLWRWTRSHLQVRDDYLFAWRWSRQKGVEDKNNATDGDLLIAWALYRAGKRWQHVEYSEAALFIVRDIRSKLVKQVGDYWVLLPGEYGFVKENTWQVNLSYWVYPALEELAVLDRSSVWQKLIQSGKTLTALSRQGRWNLPPDWIELKPGSAPTVSAERPPRFGYEVVRVPLYLIWAGDFDEKIIKDSSDFWSQTASKDYAPAWVDLTSGEVAEYEAPDGFKAVHNLSKLALDKPTDSAKDLMSIDLKEQDYYSSSLILLSRIAYHERLKQ